MLTKEDVENILNEEKVHSEAIKKENDELAQAIIKRIETGLTKRICDYKDGICCVYTISKHIEGERRTYIVNNIVNHFNDLGLECSHYYNSFCACEVIAFPEIKSFIVGDYDY